MSRTNGSSKPAKAAETSREREPGRLRAALAVLLGERLVPRQLHAEWAEYQMVFDDLLKRLSAQLARQARAEKARVERLLEAEGAPSPSPSSRHPKAHLYSLARQRIGAVHGPDASALERLRPSSHQLSLQEEPE